jgi:hypothetical protein
MTTNAVLDRIEGEVAVVEINAQTYDLPLSCLPSGAKEGDRLCIAVSLGEPHTAKVAREHTSGPEVIDI